jgi:outer membrane protein assembly factor BamB
MPGASSELLRFDPATGQPLESVSVDRSPERGSLKALSSFSVFDQGLYATSGAKALYGLPRELPAWNFLADAQFPFLPVAVGPSLYAATIGANEKSLTGLFALDASAGNLKWSASTNPPVRVAADAQQVAVADDAGTVHVYDPQTGFLLWLWKGSARANDLLLSDSRVIVSDDAGTLHLLDALDGAELWTYPAHPPAGANGRFHVMVSGGIETVGVRDTYLYALREDGLLLAFHYGNYGDLNGDGKVTVADASLALQAAVGLAILTVRQEESADVSPSPGPGRRPLGDGKADLRDVISILRRAVGLQPSTWPF